MHRLRFGLFVPQGWILDLVDIEDPIEQFETMSRVAKTAEHLGFDSIWLFDHFQTYHRPVLETTFECWTSTAALARDTSRIRIGQMVTCNACDRPGSEREASDWPSRRVAPLGMKDCPKDQPATHRRASLARGQSIADRPRRAALRSGCAADAGGIS